MSLPKEPHEVQILYQPYAQIILHEVIERKFPEFVDDVINQIRALTPPGQPLAIPTINWCNGVVFSITTFNPNSEAIIQENLAGNIHYSAVVFAIKEKFDPELKRGEQIVRMLDQSPNRNFLRLAAKLKSFSTIAKIPEVKV